MLEALGITALVLTALSALFLIMLVMRRVALMREERRRIEAELRLRPAALAIVDGEDVDTTPLSAEDGAVLAELIGRFSRSLTGDARARIAVYFSGARAFAVELGSLRDPRAWRRATAAYRLGDMACDDAIPHLLAALDDRDGDVRAAAARSLGRLQAPEASAPLVRALVGGAVPRAIGCRAVMDIGATALPELRRIAADADENLRAMAIELIGWIGGAADAGLLVQSMKDASAEVRARSAAALGRLAETDGAAALTDALDDRVYFVRLHAARALGQIGEQSAVGRLLRQAREDRFEAARAAAEAVAAIDPETLLAAADAPDAGPHLHEAADLIRV